MSPRQLLLGLAVVLIAAGVFLGMRTVAVGDISCGSVFSPSSADAEQADFSEELGGTLSGATPDTDTTNNQAACDSAVSDKKPITYGLLGLGGVAAIASLLASSGRRSNVSAPGTHQQ